ncbi:MAG: sugar transferase, partial [Clostridiaceae bacterium]|nr:sugar transferase [Clostridiaceae bacterium]
MIYSQLLSLFEVNVLMYIVAWLLIRSLPPILPVLGVMAIQLVFAIIWSYGSQAWYYHTFPANKTVIVYDMRQGIAKLIEEYNLEKKFKVVSAISADECIKDLTVLEDADTVFLIGVHSHDRSIVTKYCLMHDIKAFVIPRVGDLIISGSKRTHMFHLLMLKVERYNPPFEYLVLKRIGDIILSLIAIVLFSPVILITAVCIKAEDHGPILYKQCRLTKDGKKFNVYKFRSMRTDAEKDGIARLSTGDNDDRITRVGRFIRKVRIDEIPQLFNILTGDLTIVGPRAERPELAAEYEKQLPEFALRLQAKAGLTGLAQVYGKYNTT